MVPHFSRFLAELNAHSSSDPAILLLGIFPREMKINIHTKSCKQMVIALFITDEHWKQPKKCLVIGEYVIPHKRLLPSNKNR